MWHNFEALLFEKFIPSDFSYENPTVKNDMSSNNNSRITWSDIIWYGIAGLGLGVGFGMLLFFNSN